MSNITLRFLKHSDENEFLRAFNENWEQNFDFVHYWESIANKSFQKYVIVAPEISKGKYIPMGHVPCTLLFAFNDKGQIVGRTSIRHELTDQLLREGGHIGYGICPRFRRKGYATQVLKESLSWVKNNLPEIEKVLVTCDEGNIGSQKTIEKNNGVLENIIEVGRSYRKMRYWISVN